MTQAVNLANFANNLDSSGGVSPSALNATVPLSKGGTNATTAAAARDNLGVGNDQITDTLLSATGVTADTYGSSVEVPVITVTDKGRITNVTLASIAAGQYLGTAAVKAIAYNAQTIAEDITITAGLNALSAGPITIADGYTVTVDTTSNWTIV